MLKDKLQKTFFKGDIERMVFLGTKQQKGTMCTIINIKERWKSLPLDQKLLSILKFGWEPTDDQLSDYAAEVLKRDIFGPKEDYGPQLFKNIYWHASRDWDLTALERADIEKAEAITGMTVLSRIRFRQRSKLLSLKLSESHLPVCHLTHPMIVKVPVQSLQFYLDIHAEFAFNSIRRAKHPKANEIIAYLYEILLLHQKVAATIHDYVRLLVIIQNKKESVLLTTNEVDAIMNADQAFTYLKAAVEKNVVLVGLIHSIDNLDSIKTHGKKIKKLNESISDELKVAPYYKFVLELLKPEYLENLNNYRTGLLHKTGIADLQPHSLIGKKPSDFPFTSIFTVLQQQHKDNTAVLLSTLAMLTDELVRLDPPDVKKEDLPY
jgi:hypothetical protein